ncbi:hypothetical protein K438DRAFT_1626107, partial [Mycena galopus ATCC 62051]
IRDISRVCNAVAAGDLTQKITVPAQGDLMVQLKSAIYTMVDNLSHFAAEVTRKNRDVWTEGKLGAQARVERVESTWRKLTNEVTAPAVDLTTQVRSIAAVTKAVAKGDLSKQIEARTAKSEIDALKATVNRMVDQFSALASEVTGVAVKVVTEGKFGSQAEVEGVQGTWQDLTDHKMALNLTHQVRPISEVSKAIACGDLSQKIYIDVRGEMLDLKVTINTMVDNLNQEKSLESRCRSGQRWSKRNDRPLVFRMLSAKGAIAFGGKWNSRSQVQYPALCGADAVSFSASLPTGKFRLS